MKWINLPIKEKTIDHYAAGKAQADFTVGLTFSHKDLFENLVRGKIEYCLLLYLIIISEIISYQLY